MTTYKEKKREWIELLILLDRTAMSQAELARDMGVSPSYLNDAIKGRRPVSSTLRKSAAAVLRVPQTMLMAPPEGSED